MKNFADVNIGDPIYLIEIDNTEIKKDSGIKELKITSIEKAANSIRLKITLSNNTVITPSGMFEFHTPPSLRNEDGVYEEIYATSREECIQIASNVIKINISKANKEIEKYKNQIIKLAKCTFDLLNIKRNIPVEVFSETVIV